MMVICTCLQVRTEVDMEEAIAKATGEMVGQVGSACLRCRVMGGGGIWGTGWVPVGLHSLSSP